MNSYTPSGFPPTERVLPAVRSGAAEPVPLLPEPRRLAGQGLRGEPAHLREEAPRDRGEAAEAEDQHRGPPAKGAGGEPGSSLSAAGPPGLLGVRGRGLGTSCCLLPTHRNLWFQPWLHSILTRRAEVVRLPGPPPSQAHGIILCPCLDISVNILV